MSVIKIIGISGTNGSGKDTVGQMLAERHGWLFISVTEILRGETKRRGLAIERKNLRALSAEWRGKYGLGVLVDKAVQIYKPQAGQYKGLVISSLRNPGEADSVHQLGGQVVWVDANPRIRYKRIYSRQRSAEDDKTFAQFMAAEDNEMHSKDGQETSLNMAGVKAKTDIFIQNDGSDIKQFKDQAKKALLPYINN